MKAARKGAHPLRAVTQGQSAVQLPSVPALRVLRGLDAASLQRLGRRELVARVGSAGVVWPASGGYLLEEGDGELRWLFVDPSGTRPPEAGGSTSAQTVLESAQRWAANLGPAGHRLTEEAFWALCTATSLRLEYLDGVLYAMGYATPAHEAAVAAAIAALTPGARASGCRVYGSNLAVATESLRRFRNPDVTVVCGPLKEAARAGFRVVENPTLLVEVVSATTEGEDRGAKVEGTVGLTA